MYMPKAKNLRQVPNATYIPLARVGGFVLGDAKKFASPNAKDTKMLVSPTQNSGVGGIAQLQPPTPGILRRSGI